MFRNLANYLLGYTVEEEPEDTTTSNNATAAEGDLDVQQQQQQQQRNNIRLTSRTTEDDWVLVDQGDSEGNSEHSSDESESEPNVTETETRLSRTSSTSSLPYGSVMEDSWFITPPPCFTSTGPVHMETNPLENLLIEHPSMSVYHQQQFLLGFKRHTSAETIATVVVEEEEEEEEEDELESNVRGAVEEDEVEEVPIEEVRALQQLPRRYRPDELRQQEMQGARQKQAQKVQIQKACQSLKRGYLERNNKAREVNCRNQRLRRGERSQGATRSYANNNRKC